MAATIYSLQMLYKIPQIDAALALKKTGAEKVLFGYIAEFSERARLFLSTYEEDKVFKSHAHFLDDVYGLKDSADKLYGATVIWDADALIKAFMSGNRADIREKLDGLKINIELVLKHIEAAKCDREGNLLVQPQDTGINGDEELAAQPECGKRVGKNFVPIDKFERMAALVDLLELDEAAALAKKQSIVYYNEMISMDIRRFIRILGTGDYEKAGELISALIEASKRHNIIVESRVEEVRPRVLVVDDVPDMLLTIKGILIDICHVCTVTNYISALRFLENCHADLILLDIELDDVDGFELLKMIRDIRKYANTPVIFLTGNISRDAILRAIDAGICDYLRKPIDAELLISRVKKNLAGWKPPRHTA